MYPGGLPAATGDVNRHDKWQVLVDLFGSGALAVMLAGGLGATSPAPSGRPWAILLMAADTR